MKKGDIVKGRITNIKSYGAFVKVEDKHDGLIHISEISDGYVRNIEDYLTVGDEVTVEVIKVQGDKISFSYKSQNKTGRKKRESTELKTGFRPLEEQMKAWVDKYQKDDE
ncbi:MAG TPA: S1 RNA-binding domain-containing protein [Candidatus Izemoplasmatales bacterium]|nr:S1 RNA-binding domain-containing protein [Candidatus Izemoplasmatales bacterium]